MKKDCHALAKLSCPPERTSSSSQNIEALLSFIKKAIIKASSEPVPDLESGPRID
jgi:hypothetical protein